MDEILKKIVEKRIYTIKKKGFDFGLIIPEKRKVPVVVPENFSKGIVICEIKRGSPSEGLMNKIPDPVKYASLYIKSKADVISILTEEDFFYGSLIDLMKIKNANPKISVLRKDFIIYEEEIEISYNAGADLVLLIANVLISMDKRKTTGLLRRFKEKVENYGMLPLIEVHNEEELDKVLNLEPKLIGINSRDLKTFKINRGYPIALRNKIPNEINVVYESGIRNRIDSFFAGYTGFNSILVGSSIIKSKDIKRKIKELKKGFFNGIKSKSDFYNKIFNKIYLEKRTVVKICGITNSEDAEMAVDLGADIIGFVFTDSPREITIVKAKSISKNIGGKVLKVGVVVDKNIKKVRDAVKAGWLDAIQFHGDITNEKADSYGVSWYKAVRVKSHEDFHKEYFSPIVLYDAFSDKAIGGTGKTLDSKLLKYADENGIKLCLAGGLNPENIRKVIREYAPIMIDASSGLEKSPGIKDEAKMKKFFDEILIAEKNKK